MINLFDPNAQQIVIYTSQKNSLRDQLFREIEAAESNNDLINLVRRVYEGEFKNDEVLHEAWKKKSDLIELKMNEERQELKRRVSTFDEKIPDEEFKQQVRAQIPPDTFEVNVITLERHQFFSGSKKARKIELVRSSWGWFSVPILDGIIAGISSLMMPNSIYRVEINPGAVKRGILASSVLGDPGKGIPVNAQEKSESDLHIEASYWKGKKIIVIIPCDFSDEGEISLIDESKILTFSINGGSKIRSYF